METLYRNRAHVASRGIIPKYRAEPESSMCMMSIPKSSICMMSN
jgi:hypothetical protein